MASHPCDPNGKVILATRRWVDVEPHEVKSGLFVAFAGTRIRNPVYDRQREFPDDLR